MATIISVELTECSGFNHDCLSKVARLASSCFKS